MTDDEIQAVIDRAEATPVGPWKDDGVDCFDEGANFVRLVADSQDELMAEVHTGAFDGTAAHLDPKAKAIVTFIVAARADVPALGRELLEVRRQLRETKARLERLCVALDEEGALYALAFDNE